MFVFFVFVRGCWELSLLCCWCCFLLCDFVVYFVGFGCFVVEVGLWFGIGWVLGVGGVVVIV